MTLKTTLIAGGLAAALGAGAAFAQSGPEAPPPSQMASYGHHHHGHGVLALIREEMGAGRISQREGMLLEKKIKEMKRERRAERQARHEGMQDNGRGYGPGSEQGNPPPPPSQQAPR